MKTPFQKFYSFFGVWTYHEMLFQDNERKNYLVIYWCKWPWKFKEKIELFRIDRTKQYNKNLERQYALIRDQYKEDTNERAF